MHQSPDRRGRSRWRTNPAVAALVTLVAFAVEAVALWLVAGYLGLAGAPRVSLAIGVAVVLALTSYRAQRR